MRSSLNGKVMMIIAIMLSFGLFLSAQSRQIDLSTQASQTRLSNNSDLGFDVQFRIGRLSVQETQTQGGIYDELSIEGYGFTGEIGQPKLPMQRQLIAVPLGAQVRYSIISSTPRRLAATDTQLRHPILPAQESVSKSADPASIEFIVKSEAYAVDRFSQQELIQVREIGIMRGVRLFELEYYPVGYNPVSGELNVVEELNLRVDFVNPDLISTTDLLARTASFEYDRFYAKTIFNWQRDDRPSLVRYPTKLLILTPPNYVSTLQPFVDWKKQQGYNVIVTTVGTGGTVTNTTTAIKTYMQNLWNAATAQDPAPTYLLIVGDTSTSGDNIIANTGESSTAHVTDLTYVRLNGTDYLPEMYYGRFSVSSATELTNIVNKSITFEKTQMPDLSYLGNVVMIAGVDASYAPTYGNGQINYGTTHYFNSTNGLTSDTYLYPASGSSDAQIIANANSGRGYMNYTAHGSETSWADPTFSVSDVNAMTNTNKYGVMVGNCCITNKFNYTSGPCFGEAIIRKANAGGVAYIGATNNSYWDEDYWWGIGYKTPIQSNPHAYNASTLGAYDSMFHTHSEAFTDWGTTVGEINYMGNTAVQQSTSTRKPYYWEIYSIMGDPSLMPYLKVPTVNTATFPATILIGATSINVTATPYSRVALTMGGTLYGTAIVPASGTLTLTITPFASTGTATLVITAQNKITRIESITIAPNSGPYLNVNTVTYSDANNNVAEYNETGRFSVTFQNVGSAAATNVTATLTCSTAGITITDGSEAIAALAAGASVTQTNAFTFNIANNIANGTMAQFTITSTMSGQSPWVHNFSQVINAPAPAFGNMSISDPTGNNNGRLDPGETVTITMPLNNSGLAASPSGNATLTCSTPGITVNTGTASFAAISAGGTASLSFSITAGAGVTIGTVASLVFNATAGSYTAGKTETTTVGIILEDFETGNFNAYPWTMGGNLPWVIDNTTAQTGTYSAKSGTITHSQSSTIETTRILSASGTLSFWYKVTSESGYDYLKFYIDGALQNQWAGTIDWTQATYTLNAGTRVLKWEYMKDGSVSTGADCAWLDNIIFPASTAPSNFNPPQNLTATAGNGFVNLAWQAPASGTPTGYKIFRNSALLTTVTGLSYTDSSVVNETTYSYYLKSVYSGGESDPTATVSATPTAIVPTEAILGSGTASTGTSDAAPINIWYKSLHGQSVYTVAELNAAGISGPRNITQIGFNITGLPALAMPNFVVRMGHTTASNAASWTTTGLTQVWSSTSYLPTTTGWNMYTLTTPFQWNGTSNIVIDTAFGLMATYNQSGTVQYTTVTSGYRFGRSDTIDQTNLYTGSDVITSRPNVKMVFQPSATGPVIAVNPASLSYGNVAVGASSTQQFTISNSGDQTLTGNITTPTGYTVAQAARSTEPALSVSNTSRNTLSFSVNAGQSKTYNLSFAPTAATAYNGNVVITSNAANSATVNLAVSGTGYIPPSIDLSTDALYTALQPGEEGNQNFTITNTGSQPLNFTIGLQELRAGLRDNQFQLSNNDRSIAGSTLSVDANAYLPGTTVDWTFTVVNASTDSEWLKDVIITFPAGVTVNSATNFVGGDGGDMIPNQSSGSEITITWHGETSSGWGVVYGNGDSATATVNLSIGTGVAGNLSLAYTLNGDVYNAEPHTLSDVIVIPQDVLPIEWLSVAPLSGSVAAGQSVSVTAYFSAIGVTPGTYEALLTISSNDPINPSLQVNATMDVAGPVNHAPVIIPPDVLNFDKNGSLSVSFSPYVSDPDSDPLTLSCSGNSNINVEINGLSVNFTAAQNWIGAETLTFTVSDGSLSASAQVTVQVDPVSTPAWTPVVYPTNSATVLGIVTVNGLPAQLNDVVGAFCGAECRGVAEVVTNAGNAYVTLPVSLATDGETISFKVWGYATRTTYPVVSTQVLNFGDLLGEPTPHPINAVDFIGPISTVAPLAIVFGDVAVGTHNTQQFTISNSGDQTLTGSISTPAGFNVEPGRRGTLQGSRSNSASQRNTLPYSVEPGSTVSFSLSFNPSAVMEYSGAVSVTGNDPTAPETLISVSGTGFTHPNLSVDLSSIELSLAWGTAAERSFSIANDGSRTLNFSIVEDPLADWMSVSPSEGSLGVESQTVTVSFSAGTLAPGTYTSTLMISSNDPDQPLVQIPVQLEVTNDPPVINLPASCSFPMNEPLVMDFAPYVSDVNGQNLSLGCSGNLNVNIVIDGMNVTFSAVDEWWGTEIITFWVFDGYDYAYASMDVSVELVVPETPVLDPIPQVTPDTGVVLSWQPVQYATQYEIWRSLTSPVSGFELIATVESPSFIDAFTHDKAFYMIKAVNNPITKRGSK